MKLFTDWRCLLSLHSNGYKWLVLEKDQKYVWLLEDGIHRYFYDTHRTSWTNIRDRESPVYTRMGAILENIKYCLEVGCGFAHGADEFRDKIRGTLL